MCLLEDVDRARQPLRERRLGPAAVTAEDVLGAPEEVGDPADVALGEREPQVGEVGPEVGPDQLDAGVNADIIDDRLIATLGGASAETSGRPGRRADVAAQHGVRVAGRLEQRVPVVAVDAGHVQRLGVLRERDGVAALGGEAPHLLGGLLDVEQRQDPARDEPARVGAAPLVDVPVVVGLDHDQVDVAVRALVEHLAGESGPVREVQARQLAARVHVADPFVDVEAAGAHLVVAGGVDVVHLRRLARDRVEAQVAAAEVAVVPLLHAVRLRSTTRGAASLYRAGTCASNMSAGSAMWSSTLIRIRSSWFTSPLPIPLVGDGSLVGQGAWSPSSSTVLNRAPAPPPLQRATCDVGHLQRAGLAADLLHAADDPLQHLGVGAGVAERHQAAVGADREPAGQLDVAVFDERTALARRDRTRRPRAAG